MSQPTGDAVAGTAPSADRPPIETHTLTGGGQQATDVAERMAGFLSEARRTLDLALYDLKLGPATERLVMDPLVDASRRGVAVRLAYNVDHAMPIPVPPPPQSDPAWLANSGIPARGIAGVPDLMHHKYVVRDGEAVLTGSTNWTDDSWTREENVIVTIRSAKLAAAYGRDFDELWTTENVAASGHFDPPPANVEGTTVRAWFSPGRGRRLAHRIAEAIGCAERRVRVASPVITAGPILGALAELAESQRIDLAGVYDATQMREVFGQWRQNPAAAWKIPVFRSLVAHAPFGGKPSTPYSPTSVHDYMHAKTVVADDVAFIGSYNLSHAGQENAENVVEIADPALAERMAAFIDGLRERYPAPALPAGG